MKPCRSVCWILALGCYVKFVFFTIYCIPSLSLVWLNARDVHAQSRILDPWCTVQYSMYQKNLSIYLKDPWQKNPYIHLVCIHFYLQSNIYIYKNLFPQFISSFTCMHSLVRPSVCLASQHCLAFFGLLCHYSVFMPSKSYGKIQKINGMHWLLKIRWWPFAVFACTNIANKKSHVWIRCMCMHLDSMQRFVQYKFM